VYWGKPLPAAPLPVEPAQAGAAANVSDANTPKATPAKRHLIMRALFPIKIDGN
jgi:hypothetical protein